MFVCMLFQVLLRLICGLDYCGKHRLSRLVRQNSGSFAEAEIACVCVYMYMYTCISVYVYEQTNMMYDCCFPWCYFIPP